MQGGAAENKAQMPDLRTPGWEKPGSPLRTSCLVISHLYHNCYSLDSFPSDVVVAVADLALEAGELAVLVARLALQALRLHHLI